MKRNLFTLLAIALFVGAATSGPAAADDNKGLSAEPFTFVGSAADCSPAPAGSRIVTAAWLGGMGLPDNGGTNGVPATRNDPHSGLLLSKNGPTPDCSSSGARIRGVEGMTVGTTFELGFDSRNGGHCGAGAPRFNVTWKLGTVDGFSFVGGCANGLNTPAPQDPAEWTRSRFTAAQQFPAVPAGAKIVAISILFDEGTDTPTVQDPMGVGLAVIDNIDINGTLITHGNNTKSDKDKSKDKDKGGDDNDQGDDD